MITGGSCPALGLSFPCKNERIDSLFRIFLGERRVSFCSPATSVRPSVPLAQVTSIFFWDHTATYDGKCHWPPPHPRSAPLTVLYSTVRAVANASQMAILPAQNSPSHLEQKPKSSEEPGDDLLPTSATSLPLRPTTLPLPGDTPFVILWNVPGTLWLRFLPLFCSLLRTLFSQIPTRLPRSFP